MNKKVTLLFTMIAASAVSAQKPNMHIDKMQLRDKVGSITIYADSQEGTAFVGYKNGIRQVLGYSDTPYVKGMELPGGLKMWLDMASQYVYTDNAPYIYGAAPQDVPNFVTTRWSQEKPYNNKCPQINLKRPVAGCVATAMAQICNYYEYPAQGQGECEYYITKVVAGESKTDTKHGKLSDKYDWPNMLDSYSGTYTTAQADAVATLMRDCGYASSMYYGRESSGANMWAAARGLADNLQYDSLSLQLCTRFFYSDSEWHSLVYRELNAKRPILYVGDSDEGGHAFVFDGVQSDGKVHINWGWGGNMDGYYDMDVMSSKAEFTERQQMIIGFKPEPTDANSVAEYSPCIAIFAEVESDGQDLLFNGGVFNYDWHYFKGDVAMVLNNTTMQAADSLYFFEEEYEGEDGNVYSDICAPFYGYAWGDSYNSDPLRLNQYFLPEDNQAFPPGDYVATFIVSAYFEDEFQPVRANGGKEWIATFTVGDDGNITITDPETAVHPVIASNRLGGNIYNLSGQRLAHPSRGVNIQSGRKLIIR